MRSGIARNVSDISQRCTILSDILTMDCVSCPALRTRRFEFGTRRRGWPFEPLSADTPDQFMELYFLHRANASFPAQVTELFVYGTRRTDEAGLGSSRFEPVDHVRL